MLQSLGSLDHWKDWVSNLVSKLDIYHTDGVKENCKVTVFAAQMQRSSLKLIT